MRLLEKWFPANVRAKAAKLGEQTDKILEEAMEQHDAHRDAVLFPSLRNRLHEVEEVIDCMIACDGKLDMFDENLVLDAVERVRRKGEKRGDWKCSN